MHAAPCYQLDGAAANEDGRALVDGMSGRTLERQHQPGVMTGIALLLPITLTTMAVVLLAPVLPKLMAEFSDVSGHEYLVPMVLTLPSLCVAVLCPFAGLLGDRFGRRKLLLAALLLYAVVGVAPVFLSDLTHILISRICVGVAEALIYVMSTTMIGDHFTGKARDRWLAGQTAFASLSALLFFNLGGVLGELGWRAPFWAYLSALVMFVLVLRYTAEPGVHNAAGDAGDEAEPAWRGRFPWGRMGLIVGITIYGSVFFYTVQIQASTGLVALGLDSAARIGLLTSIASLGVPLGTFVYSRIAAVGPRRLLAAEFALLATGFVLMGRSLSVPMFLIGCFINQLGAGMLLPTLLVWSMSILPFGIRARGTGFWQSSFALGQWLSPLAVTTLSLQFGGLGAAFSILGIVAGLGLVVTLLSRLVAGPGKSLSG